MFFLWLLDCSASCCTYTLVLAKILYFRPVEDFFFYFRFQSLRPHFLHLIANVKFFLHRILEPFNHVWISYAKTQNRGAFIGAIFAFVLSFLRPNIFKSFVFLLAAWTFWKVLQNVLPIQSSAVGGALVWTFN
jgi:hypothetical protein